MILTYDTAFPPSSVSALQGCSHHLYVSRTVESIIDTPTEKSGQIMVELVQFYLGRDRIGSFSSSSIRLG